MTSLMKIRFLLLLFCLICGSSYSTSPPRILVLGDSLSSAFGLTVDQGWVHLLQQRLQQDGFPHQVINASISGDTTTNGLARLTSALDTHQPSIVIVELGGNDGLRAQPVSMIKENLDTIIETVTSSGSDVLLAGMRLPPNYGPTYVEQFERIYPDLAESKQVSLIPFFMNNVAAVPGLMQMDGVHPNAAAQSILLDNVWPHLHPLLE